MLDTAIGIRGGYEILTSDKHFIQWTAEDPSEFQSANYNSSTNKWVAPRETKVGFHVQVLFALNGTSRGERQNVNLSLYRNGVLAPGSLAAVHVPTGNNDSTTISLVWYGKVNAGDSFDVAFQSDHDANRGTAILMDVGSSFTVEVFDN